MNIKREKLALQTFKPNSGPQLRRNCKAIRGKRQFYSIAFAETRSSAELRVSSAQRNKIIQQRISRSPISQLGLTAKRVRKKNISATRQEQAPRQKGKVQQGGEKEGLSLIAWLRRD